MRAPAQAWVVTFAFLLFAIGCDDEDVTLVVDVKTDLVPGVELHSIRTSLLTIDIDGGSTGSRFVDVAVALGADFLSGQRVAELSGLEPGRVRVLVEARAADGTVRASRRVIVDLDVSRAVTVVIARSCLGVSCPMAGGDVEATECFAGRCVEPECSEETPERCGPPACANDTECPGGAACGVGRCVAGGCLIADDGTCGSGAFCDPELGCTALPGDGGAVDGGVDAATPDGGADAGPTLVPLVDVSQIQPGDGFTCVIADLNAVLCWGENPNGQLGDGTTMPRILPTSTGIGGSSDIGVGTRHACAVYTGGRELLCWGRNNFGQVGDGFVVDALAPAAVPLVTVQDVAGGSIHTCAIHGTGAVSCWGANDLGQLGSGSFTSMSVTPLSVGGLTNATQIDAAANFTCALAASGGVSCWGSNASGQLGDGTRTDWPAPVTVMGLAGPTQICTGTDHACAVLRGGSVACWGGNNAGQLGDGTGGSSTTPVAVLGLGDVEDVACGRDRTCARRATGAVVCWGDATDGALGDGTAMGERLMPGAEVTGLSDATAIAGYRHHFCAIRADGTAVCWGANAQGELGDGTTIARATPVTVMVAP